MEQEAVTVDVFEPEPLLFMSKCEMAQHVLDRLQEGHAVLIAPIGYRLDEASITWQPESGD